ncbi:hypothetical protein D0S48_12160 [Psychrobacillus sp. AK 1817]|nr:hypothetical protein D0S48_12160 [Psychrobacillus sp. AK 1817]
MCEKAEGQRVRGSKEERLGAYSIRENRSIAADEEICRPSGFAAAPMVVGGSPARVGRRWYIESRHQVTFVLVKLITKRKTKGIYN